MGRAAILSRENALRGAMKLFWSRGYSAATMDDLQNAIGLQRGSLYAYFKNKKALFQEALDLYQSEIVLERRKKVQEASSAKEGVELFFQMIIDHSLENPEFPGCLNTNTAAELSVIDKEISIRLSKGLKAWEKFWIEILEKAKREGELSKEKDSREIARLLITLTQGINVISKVNPNREYLNSVVNVGLSVIN